jgi:hypothetical protein
MLQRGRKSAASTLVHLVETDTGPRLTAPSTLRIDEQRLFDELVADNRHLTRSDGPLLTAYVLASGKVQKLARGKDTDGFVKALRAMAAVASKLRLCPSAVTDPKTIGRQRRDTANDAAAALFELNDEPLKDDDEHADSA